MGYTVKWICDNLGITRDMLRYYEKKKLLPMNEGKKTRDFNDEDLKKIWSIKILISIGFSTEEIYSFMNNSCYDFYAAITNKVAELEQKHDENMRKLEFAKTIKTMGTVPSVLENGSMRFGDFITYVQKNWNFYDNPRTAPFMKITDTLMSKEPQEWSLDDVERMVELLEKKDAEWMIHTYTIQGYFKVIADMQEYGYSDDIVQKVVRLLHEYMFGYYKDESVEVTPQSIAKYIASSFLDGDIAKLLGQSYGEKECMFIAQALAYYGGYDIEDL